MGILDDAIREHLELKRRRGADPTEIERAEHEALGPVRPAPDTITAEELEVGGAYAYDPADSPGSLAEDAHDEVATQLYETPVHDEPDFDPFPEASIADDQHTSGAARPAEAVPQEEYAAPGAAHGTSAGPASGGHPPGGDETVEYTLPDEVVRGGAPPPSTEPRTDPARGAHPEKAKEGEDVLEDTPEFLQDTPDHDRLWFEQKPPRDFDFDH